jgi:hypothetical protein
LYWYLNETDPEIENLLALLSALEYLEEAKRRANVRSGARADALGAIDEALSRELDGSGDFSA